MILDDPGGPDSISWRALSAELRLLWGNDSLEKENLIVQERRESIPGAMSLIRWKKMGSEAEREILSSLVLWLDKRIGHLWVTGEKVEHTNTGAGRWLLLHIFQFLWSRKQSHHGKVRIREEVWGAGRRRENEKAIWECERGETDHRKWFFLHTTETDLLLFHLEFSHLYL